jgi:hypothetical protein
MIALELSWVVGNTLGNVLGARLVVLVRLGDSNGPMLGTKMEVKLDGGSYAG